MTDAMNNQIAFEAGKMRITDAMQGTMVLYRAELTNGTFEETDRTFLCYTAGILGRNFPAPIEDRKMENENENENENEMNNVECAFCQSNVSQDDINVTLDGDEICEECKDEKFVTTCGGDIILKEDSETTLRGYVEHCDDVSECNNCSNFDYHDNLVHTYNDGEMCQDCIDNDYVYCVDIDDYLFNENAHWDSDSEEWYYEERTPRNLLNYCYNIFDRYGKVAIVKENKTAISKHLVFGIELETETRGESASDIADAIETEIEGWAICKEDGSVSGPEIVSLPACLDSHRTIGWEIVCDTLRPIAKGHHGNDNGMHIHVNTSAFRPLTLGKMLVFVNDPNNRALLGLIAQRKFWENHYCDARSSNFNSVGKAGKFPQYTKFSPLNVTGIGTAEFRIFKSTLMPDRIIKNVEFCHALVKWCEQESVQELTSDNFTQYVAANTGTYKILNDFISQRQEA